MGAKFVANPPPMTAALLVKLLDGTTHLLTTSSPGNAALRVQDILAKYAPASEIDSICLSCNGKPVESDEDLACLSPMSVMQMSVAAAEAKCTVSSTKPERCANRPRKLRRNPKRSVCANGPTSESCMLCARNGPKQADLVAGHEKLEKRAMCV